MLGCNAGTAQSTGLHRGYTGCCRCRHMHRGDSRDSWCLWFWSCRCCRCSGWRLWQLCRHEGCRQWCRNVRSGRSLWCGWCDIWGGVSGLDTTFMEVLPCVAVDHTITDAHLLVVFQQDMYHSGRDPDFTEGVIHCNRLASTQGCKGLASFIYLWLGGIGAVINSFMSLEGCQISGAGMVVLIWHWYRSSAGDGSLVSMGVAQSNKRASCGSVPLYLAHWRGSLMEFTHASANPFNCG